MRRELCRYTRFYTKRAEQISRRPGQYTRYFAQMLYFFMNLAYKSLRVIFCVLFDQFKARRTGVNG